MNEDQAMFVLLELALMINRSRSADSYITKLPE
jgi:hypothetical protein